MAASPGSLELLPLPVNFQLGNESVLAASSDAPRVPPTWVQNCKPGTGCYFKPDKPDLELNQCECLGDLLMGFLSLSPCLAASATCWFVAVVKATPDRFFWEGALVQR